MSLNDLQDSFASALLDPAAPMPDAIASPSSLKPVRRFNVYRNNVVASLTDVLKSYFPVVARLVGPDFFQAVAREYIIANLPASPILSRYGTRFPAFIDKFGPTRDLIYLKDVASLELLKLRAYHAADAASLSATDLSQVPADCISSLVFQFHPAACLFKSRWPAVSIWWTNTLDVDVKPIDLDSGSEEALVLRPGLDVAVMRLPAGAYEFVEALKQGECLSEATKAAVTASDAFEFERAITALLDGGALSGFANKPHGSDRSTRDKNQ